MNVQALSEHEERFYAYVQSLAKVIGHKDREQPLLDYSKGLLLELDRKSVEPMAAAIAPEKTSPKHQSLVHFVANSSWSDAEILAEVRKQAAFAMEKHGPIEAWIVDDTGLLKKGKHSVGVARQYCGQIGKQDNCQVAASLSVANHYASLPIGYRLYLPEEWANDEPRRKKAGVPDDVIFKTKSKIALDLIHQALADGVPRGVVLADPAYGRDTDFRDALTGLGLPYVMGVMPQTTVWPPGEGPLPPRRQTGKGRPETRLRRDAEHQPLTVKAMAFALKERDWRTVTWREGSDQPLKSRFARLRVRPAHRDYTLIEPRAEEWLLIEWPEGEAEPTKYWLSTLPADTGFAELVDTAKLRWRIERDYEELKQEVGLGHYEGRGWRGFHHHATLCIAAYGFLVIERAAFPPSGPAAAMRFKKPQVPNGYSPRGASLANPASCA